MNKAKQKKINRRTKLLIYISKTTPTLTSEYYRKQSGITLETQGGGGRGGAGGRGRKEKIRRKKHKTKKKRRKKRYYQWYGKYKILLYSIL